MSLHVALKEQEDNFPFLCMKQALVPKILACPNKFCQRHRLTLSIASQAAAAAAQPALLKTPMAQSQQAYSTAFNTARAINAAGLAQVQAAQAQPVTAASYAALGG